MLFGQCPHGGGDKLKGASLNIISGSKYIQISPKPGKTNWSTCKSCRQESASSFWPSSGAPEKPGVLVSQAENLTRGRKQQNLIATIQLTRNFDSIFFTWTPSCRLATSLPSWLRWDSKKSWTCSQKCCCESCYLFWKTSNVLNWLIISTVDCFGLFTKMPWSPRVVCERKTNVVWH